MQNTLNILEWTIFGSLSTIIIFLVFIRYILNLYTRKHREFEAEINLKNLEKESSILKTRIDVHEETIQKISKELHDNVNQILTLAKLNLNNIDPNKKEVGKIEISKDLITNAINELSNLSSSLSSQSIKDIGLTRTLEIERERIMQISRTNLILHIDFNRAHTNEEEELILFRIFQEATRNSIIHGKASTITVIISQKSYSDLYFEISDNGTGFLLNDYNNSEYQNKHQGIKNMKRRSSIINADFILESSPQKGTKIIIRKCSTNQ